MKVTKEKRAEIRRALVAAAVEIVVEKGLSDMTIREVAARAEVAPGTAYKYFPNRDQLVYAYFELKLSDAACSLEALPNFADFSLKEKLQALLEALLAEYLPEREFVAIALRGLIDSPFHAFGAMNVVKRELLGLVAKYLNEAVEKGQFPASSHQGFVVRTFWDVTTLIILYWLNDDSENFTRSSQFIDQGLDLYVALVQSGIADKAIRLGGFLLKNHMHEHLSLIGNLFGSLSNLRQGGNGGAL